jgi:2-keto-4-pentenoate hydratase/2-oxohepta-3-ene-1,7-dioic acid hydratase in catechol pathway
LQPKQSSSFLFEGVTLVKFCRFEFEGESLYGRVEFHANAEAHIEEILTESPYASSTLNSEAAHLASLYRETAVRVRAHFSPLPITEAHLLPPSQPTKIICVGRNYRDHAKELGNEVPTSPLIFMKPPSSLLSPGALIRRPAISERVDYEGELTVVIGKRARKLDLESNWRSHILGYTIANDVTARDLQNKDGQWTRAKGFDTFCPIGPFVSDEIDPNLGVEVETRVNGQLKQHGNTRDFIFNLPELFVYITSFMTLEPGDLILTGTPAGVGPLISGDRVEVTIPSLGTLSNSVADDEKP